jgi:hypothetical protein
MTRWQRLAMSVFGAGLFLSAAQNNNGNLQITGQWSLTPGKDADRVQMTLHWKSAQHTMNSTMEWSMDRQVGLSPAQVKSGGSVQFRISREAGTLNCEGFLKNGSGGGVFTFTVNRGFVDAMGALGYVLSDEQVFAMAVHDVTTSYVKALRAEGIQVEGADKLIAMRIHNVTVEYVREMRQFGLGPLNADKLIAMRIHGVAPEFARDLKALGYSSVSTDNLIAMRIHGASIEFVRQLEGLGYKHPSIDQLITMRIHRVTPEYIQKLQARGMKNLSIDQLVGLRIHGIVD